LLDTCVLIDLETLPPSSLPLTSEVAAVTVAELSAARIYGNLSALVIAAGRNPRPRRLDLMIAATAVVHQLPLFTRNSDDFKSLESQLDVVSV
jgi:predicted nucleic acid-binding protein